MKAQDLPDCLEGPYTPHVHTSKQKVNLTMPVESATYIDTLNSSNPLSGDGVVQGDDHIRLIKNVLQATFPNIDGPVTGTPDEINNGLLVPGLIMWWYGSIASIPSGWGLCDGSTHNLADGSGTIVSPDLTDRFIVAAGSTGGGDVYDPGDTGGANTFSGTAASNGAHTHTTDSQGAHDHGGSSGAHTLTIAEIPSHSHYIESVGDGAGGSGASSPRDYVSATTNSTEAVGGGGSHSHTISSDGGHTHTAASNGAHTHSVSGDNRPLYHALVAIMKL